ncbi:MULTISPECIES: FAD-binding and (Fe-S)-binding domain-containing protein [Nocardioides]|uniref:FAD-binding and (Fe-S)-binding domain-containing protein n=1 Tax=Nocardioides vastitatis TaxID=2568655 RepID=A0ABW0ZP82_9ACTN|nr:FAD-binding and (Fe-S)-binding domain-containing protein [Nocardioides sp.]
MSGDLVAALRGHGVDADDSTLTRALYSSDASLYRVLPAVVARPRHRDELSAVLEVATDAGVPLTMRGAGTSIAGNAVGTGIVVDTRRLDRVLEIDPEARTARVEPGVVHARLQAAAARHGLRYGPDPSTHTRCTIGGMVGNNACGSRALGYGRTSDTIRAVEVLWGDRSAAPGEVEQRLAAVVAAELGHVRTAFGTFTRQVSGYSLEHLLPEALRDGPGLARFLAGSEGTLGILREVTVALVEEQPRQLLVLGYPSMPDAADAVPALLAAGDGAMVACEGLDARLVDLVRANGPVPDLPRGAGWLLAEAAGPDATDVIARLAAASGALDSRVVTSAPEAAAIWRIREDGAGLAARSLETPAYSGWEDAAVPPAQLGAWLRDFDALLREHDLDGVPYGHFGDGCVHVRIDFPFEAGDPASARIFRDFLTAGALRLKEYGGSLSGEHGDGRARSELLPLMYDETSLRLFRAVKHAADPAGLLNPGVLVDPAPMDADLRPVRPVAEVRSALRLTHDASLGTAVHRCTGVGKCVVPSLTAGGVMCPSFLATGEEKDSTRGRSRVLQEALDGSLVRGLADPAVHEALDLCLSCKGCASDCPTGVDMATYKSEVLHQTYAGRRRPRTHYTMGRLPRWARMAAPTARIANAAMKVGPLSTLAKKAVGVDGRRSLPTFAPLTLRRWARRREGPDSVSGKSQLGAGKVPTREVEGVDVWIWADSFTDHFRTGPGIAAVRFLESAGLRVRVIDEPACCAITWITTGQLDAARRIVGRTLATLAPYVSSGVPVIALEPSCLAALRSDAVELADDPAAATAVVTGVLTFAELVNKLDLPLPDLTGTTVVAQPHCHHHAVLKWNADEGLLRRTGATLTRVPGCCGLAGNFGMEHYDVSVAVAQTHLLPAVRDALAAEPGTVVLADGLSCSLQLEDLAGVRSMHLAELLASNIEE